jgi:LysR family transcriptional regulator, carnitine catabolism transcriptional activator
VSAVNLSSRDLRALVALIDTQSFTRAAERVHLSQPAFSALIQNLEDVLGARLFHRSTRRVVLTPEGELIEPVVRRLLADLDGMVANFKAHAERRTGRVVVAALPSLAAAWLPGVLAEFHALYPGIALSLRDALAEQCMTLLRSREADIVLAPFTHDASDVEPHVLCSEQFYVVCRSDHPLANRATITSRDLVNCDIVQMSRGSSVRQSLAPTSELLLGNQLFEVEHLATVAGLVRAGFGVSIVPQLTLFHFQAPELVVRRLNTKGLKREIHVLRRRGESLSSAAQALFELILARRASLGALPVPEAHRRSAPRAG